MGFTRDLNLAQAAGRGSSAVDFGGVRRGCLPDIGVTSLLVVPLAGGDGVGRAALGTGAAGPLGIPEAPGMMVIAVNSLGNRQTTEPKRTAFPQRVIIASERLNVPCPATKAACRSDQLEARPKRSDC